MRTRIKKYFRAGILQSSNMQLAVDIKRIANRESFVYPRLGVHFDRIAKNANTYILIILNQLENGYSHPLHRDVARQNSIAPIDLSISEFHTFYTFRHLVVVRNPFDRALSVFLHKVAPGSHRLYTKFGGYGDDSAEGFKRFLQSIHSRKLRNSNHHMWPQVESLTLKDINKYTDIIHFEDLSIEFNQFLKSLGFAPNLKENKMARHTADPNKTTNSSQKRQYYFDKDAVELVLEIYNDDFEAFGYSW